MSVYEYECPRVHVRVCAIVQKQNKKTHQYYIPLCLSLEKVTTHTLLSSGLVCLNVKVM